MRGIARDCGPRAPEARRRQGGFVHVLFIVLAALGISIWGFSELFSRVQEQRRERAEDERRVINEARLALIDYALVPPPRLQIPSRAGRYSALEDGGEARPFRYFSLPCPDTASDGNLDGVSGIYNRAVGDIEDCGVLNDFRPLEAGALTGRLPWRAFSGESGGRFVYVRGAGGQRLTGAGGSPYWYAASRNLTRPDRALNLHWQVRQTSEWINLERRTQSGGGTVSLSIDRVAAVVAAPGVFGPGNAGARIPEDGGAPVAGFNITTLASAYLQPEFLAGLASLSAGVSPRVAYSQPPATSADEDVSYFTIDELAAESDRAIEAPGGLIDQLRGEGDFFGVEEMMRAHFDRRGSLPAPAPLSEEAAVRRRRPAGAPLYQRPGGALAQGARSERPLSVQITVLVPARNIGRVYLLPGSRILFESIHDFGRGNLPPYNLALYNLDTAFNRYPLAPALRADLEANGVFPRDNLFGYAVLPSAFAAPGTSVGVSLSIRTVSNPLAPLNARVYLREPPPPPAGVLAVSPQRLLAGGDAFLALADPARAFIAGTALSEAVDGEEGAADTSPPFGMQVILPAGARLSLAGAPDQPVSIALPRNLSLSAAGIIDGNYWVLTEPLARPVMFVEDSDRVITMVAALDDLPVVAGDFGFLPVDAAEPDYYDANGGARVRFMGGSNFAMPGLGVSAVAPAGGVRLAAARASSELPAPLRMYVRGRMIITPFAPPGRPFPPNAGLSPDAQRAIGLPSPLFVNHAGTLSVNVDAGREFSLPAGTRITYPPGAEIVLGASFAFPTGAMAFFPPGSEVTAEVAPDSILPGGRRSDNAAPATMAVTLAHGGFARLAGQIIDGGILRDEPARVVLREGRGVDSAQELFDIEIQSPFQAGGATQRGGAVLQPLTGRALSSAPLQLSVFRIDSQARMRLLTAPRSIVFPEAYHPTLQAGTVAFTAQAILVAGRNSGPGSVPVSPILAGTVGGIAAPDLAGYPPVRIDEQTEFMLPPGTYTIHKVSLVTGHGAFELASTFVLPPRTGLFDPEIRFPPGFMAGGQPAHPVLKGAFTLALARALQGGASGAARGAAVNQLMLMADADIEINGGRVLRAGGMIDIARGVGWQPGAVRTLPRVAEDLQALSSSPIHMYFPGGVLLETRSRLDENGDFGSPLTAALIERPARQPTGVRATVDTAADYPVSYGVHPRAFAAPLSGAGEERAAYIPNMEVGGRRSARLHLPPHSFIIIPPGEPLDFLSDNKQAPGAAAEEADYVLLPPGAVAVTPPGETVTLGDSSVGGGALFETLSGPGAAHIRLGSARDDGFPGLAIVNISSHLPESPVIFYGGDAYLAQTRGPLSARRPVAAKIPAGARGDLFGNVTRRDARGFDPALLPADAAEALRNFPMLYAVAPGCRVRPGESVADDCARGGGGLEFSAEQGERFALKGPLNAAGNIYIAAYAPSDEHRSLMISLRLRTTPQFYADAPPLTATLASGLFIADGSGMVSVDGASLTVQPSDVVEVLLPPGAPPDSVLRAYMQIAAPPAAPADLALTAHFAEMQAMTVHAGGYTGAAESARTPLGILTVQSALYGPGSPTANVQLGLGARIVGRGPERNPFGEGALAAEVPAPGGGTPFTLPLAEYRPFNAGDYLIRAVPSGRIADVDDWGNVNFAAGPGGEIAIDEGVAGDFTTVTLSALRPPDITLSHAAEITMAQGYLWQGYITPLTDLRLSADLPLTLAELEFSALSGHLPASMTINDTVEILPPRAYLRVHPTDELLNFWGSGQERAEGMDGDSPARLPPGDFYGAVRIEDLYMPYAGADREAVFAAVDDNGQIAASSAAARRIVHRWWPDGLAAHLARPGLSPQQDADLPVLGPGGGPCRATDLSPPPGFPSQPDASLNCGAANVPRYAGLRVNVRDAASGALVVENAVANWRPAVAPRRAADTRVWLVSATVSGVSDLPSGVFRRVQLVSEPDGTAFRQIAVVQCCFTLSAPPFPRHTELWLPDLRVTLPGRTPQATVLVQAELTMFQTTVTLATGGAAVGFRGSLPELVMLRKITVSTATGPGDAELGFLAMGAAGNPFPLHDQMWLGWRTDDIWLMRNLLQQDGSSHDESARMFLEVAGATVAAHFNPPPYLVQSMFGTQPFAAHSYPRAANVAARSVRRPPPCPAPQLAAYDVDVIPGVPLGSFAFVELHNRGTAPLCESADPRIASFSSRPRRNAEIATYEDLDDTRVRGELYTVSLAVMPAYTWGYPRDFAAAPPYPEPSVYDPQFCRLNYDGMQALLNNRLANRPLWQLQGGTASVFDRHLANVCGQFQATLALANFPLPRDLRARVTLPADPALSPAAEVRAAAAFSQRFGGASVAAINPKTYVIPGRRTAATSLHVAPLNPAVSAAMVANFSSSPVRAGLAGEAYFYLDRAYNLEYPAGQRGAPRTFPAPVLRIGNDFRIEGPGALVQPFGGNSPDATARAYAARSRLLYGIFADDLDRTPDGAGDDMRFKLHEVYSRLDPGDFFCPAGRDAPARLAPGGSGAHVQGEGGCPAMYDPRNVPFWIPIISGAVAFDGVQINPPSAADADIGVVVPEPQVIAEDSGGNPVTIYGGSIIHPRTGEVRLARPISADSRLRLLGPAVAAIDVSPASAPSPVVHEREDLYMEGDAFSYHPVADESGSYVIEPLGFVNDNVIHFGNAQLPALHGVISGYAHSVARGCDSFGRNDLSMPGILTPIWRQYRDRDRLVARPECVDYDAASLGGAARGSRMALHRPMRITARYDGTLARGFLMNRRMAGIMGARMRGDPVFTTLHGFAPYYPRRLYDGRGALFDASSVPEPPSDAAALGNPLSWRWVNRTPSPAFVPMGGANQFKFASAPMTNIAANVLGRPRAPEDDVEFAATYLQEFDGGGRRFNELRVSRERSPFGMTSPELGRIANEDVPMFFQFGCGQFPLREHRRMLPRNEGNLLLNVSPGAYDIPSNRYVPDVPGGTVADIWSPGLTGAAALDAAVYAKGFAMLPAAPTPHTLAMFSQLPCADGMPYWVGAHYDSSATAFPPPGGGEDDDEFVALRLPHMIEIPSFSGMRIPAHSSRSRYPLSESDYFEFPTGSVARVLQADAASWESVHPYVSRYLPGALLANDGGLYGAGGPLSTAQYDARTAGLLARAEVMRVRHDNDGQYRIEVGGKRVPHYMRSEAVADYLRANTPVHTNVWIRLSGGGFLTNESTGEVTVLPANTVVNPVLGTYLPGDGLIGASAARDLRNSYQSFARVEGEMHVARPALVIPEGATVQVGGAGAVIAEVKAAAIFSPRPLEVASCASGALDDRIAADGLPETLVVSQRHEGVGASVFADAGEDVRFSLGHPCAWADDRENTDGDRYYIYRSRRRYLEPHRDRIVSNDRTFLLGGSLRLL